MWLFLKQIPMTWVLIALMGISLFGLHGLYQRERGERIRLASNQEVLFGDLREYRVRDSLNAVSIGALNLTVREFRDNMDATASLVRDMGIKLNRLQSVATFATQQTYEVQTILKDTVIYVEGVVAPFSKAIDYRSKWFDIRGFIVNNDVRLFPVSRDSITQVVDRIPRKFLFIRWGTKGFKQDIVSHNPDSKILFSEYVYFGKR